MNNEEKILKYFSDDLTPEEKKKLENEIENSEELKKEFYKMEKLLSGFKESADVEVNENYFINLVPNVRDRIDKKRNIITIPRLAILFPLAVVLFVVSLTFNKNNNGEVFFTLKDHSEILNEILEQATEEQLGEYIDINSGYNENNFTVLTDNLEFDNKNIISIGESTLKSFDEYELINSLSEEAADEIYNKLLNTKIL